MTFLASVDCGAHGLGCALFFSGELVSAEYLPGLGGQAHPLLEPVALFEAFLEQAGEPIDELAIEIFQIYPGPQQKGDQGDLIKLAIVAGITMATAAQSGCKSICTLLPREWKGQLPKDIMIDRIKGRLSLEELAVVKMPVKSVAHNVFDGIGIGLSRLGRLEKTK